MHRALPTPPLTKRRSSSMPLQNINIRLRELQWTKPQTLHTPPPPPVLPIHKATFSTTQVLLNLSYSAIAVGTDSPHCWTSMKRRDQPHSLKTQLARRYPRRLCQSWPVHPAPPGTPTPPKKELALQHLTTIADVHRKQDVINEDNPKSFSHPAHTISPPCNNNCSTPPRPTPLPNPIPTPTKGSALARLFTPLWKGCELYQQGSFLPEILTALPPMLSDLLSIFLQQWLLPLYCGMPGPSYGKHNSSRNT